MKTKIAVTDKMRSMIASAFVGAFDSDVPVIECKRRSLCCCGHLKSYEACLQIVGGRSHRAALRLRDFFYDELGCCGWRDKEYQETQEQYFLDKIANLETL
jgi:hypothetical protein